MSNYARFVQGTLLLVAGLLTISYQHGLFPFSAPHLLAQDTGVMSMVGILLVIVGSVMVTTSRSLSREALEKDS